MIYYKYNADRRVYEDPETGIRSASPIRKYAYREWEIVEETSRSFVMGMKGWNRDSRNEIKIPKKELLKDYGFLTKEEMEQDIWIDSNKYLIRQEIDRVKDFNTLKEIAKLLNLKQII